MKIAFLAGFISVLCLISIAKAAPADGDIVEEPEAVNPSTGEEQEVVNPSSAELSAENPDNSDRENVLSCSFVGWACWTHCVAHGHWRGGYCNSRKQCVCRK